MGESYTRVCMYVRQFLVVGGFRRCYHLDVEKKEVVGDEYL